MSNNKTTVLVSGSFGDNAIQLAKLLFFVKKNKLNKNDIKIIFCNDIIDRQKAIDLHNADQYKKWISRLYEINNFYDFETIISDQRIEAESGKYDVVLSPVLNYDIKIWEDERKMIFAHRPNQLVIVPDENIDFILPNSNLINIDFDVVVQVRFIDENPSKADESFMDETQLLHVLQAINYKTNKIALIGNTTTGRTNVFSKITSNYINSDFDTQYSILLSAKKYVVGTVGFCGLLPALYGISVFMKQALSSPINIEIYSSCQTKKYITLFDKYNDLISLLNNKKQ